MTMTLDRPPAVDDTPVPAPGAVDDPIDRTVWVGGAALLVAGVMHAATISTHSAHRPAVWTFLLIAAVQLVAGSVALARPGRRVGAMVAVVGGAALVGWVVATTSGLPGIGGLDGAQPRRFADGLAAGLALLALVCGLKALVLPKLRPPKVLAVVAVMALALVAAPGTVQAVNHRHGGPGPTIPGYIPSAVPPRGFDPTKPIDLGGVAGVSPEQQARAENLLGATVRGLPQWADPAVAEANGFRSIRDGGTGVEHYINLEFMRNKTILDPDEPESLVYDTTVTPKKLVAAMYMLPPGPTIADAPDVGGALTQWHIHNNLCFTADAKIGGLTDADGNCAPPLIKGSEQPMMHVWIVPRPCGPFSALEGIGAGQIEEGETVACDSIHGG